MSVQHFSTVHSSPDAQRRFQLILILLILLTAAALRIFDLTRVPPGFSQTEIRTMKAVETARLGMVASFYNVGDGVSGYEGLYPVFQAITTSLIGDGLLCYRVLSMWCGLLSVALMYAVARRLFGRFAGLSAALALAVTLWPVILSRSAIRETLLLPLTLAMLLALSRALHLDRRIEPAIPATAAYTVLGVLVVGMAYTHWTGLMGLPLVGVFIAYLVLTRQPISRRVLYFSAFALLVILILSIPYLTFTLRAFTLSGIRAFWVNRPENVGSLINTTLRGVASIVVAGDPSPDHNLPGSALVGPLGTILLVIGLVVAARRWRLPNMALMLCTLVIGLLPAVWSRGAPDFTKMIVALPAIMALIGLGAAVAGRQLLQVKRLTQDRRAIVLLAAVGIASVLYIGETLFRRWAYYGDVDEAYTSRLGRLAAYLDRTNDGLPTTICTLNLRADENANSVPDPALLGLMMHRQNPDLRFSDCLTGLVLTQGGATQRFAYADIRGADAIPPAFKDWLSHGEPIPIDGLPPGTVLRLNVEKELADRGGKLTLGHVDWAPEAEGQSSQAVLPVRMGGYLTFEGYALPAGNVYKPGDTVRLITYWRADGPQEPDLRVFMHILGNPKAEPVLQNDILSVDASLLRDRDVFIQIIDVPLPATLPEGEYQVSVGAYRSLTQTRLPVYDANAERGNRLFLEPITVKS